MRFVFLLGGTAGFAVVGAASWWAGHDGGRVLFDAAVGCLAGALLFRWFWSVLVRGIRQTLATRQPVRPAGGPE